VLPTKRFPVVVVISHAAAHFGRPSASRCSAAARCSTQRRVIRVPPRRLDCERWVGTGVANKKTKQF
jgi:hypothetical protein